MPNFQEIIDKYNSDPKYDYIKDTIQFLMSTLSIYKDSKQLFITFNGGKDATVVLYLTYTAIYKLNKQDENQKEYFPQKSLKSIYFEEPNPFKEAVEFKENVRKELDLEEIVVERDFKKSLWKIVTEQSLQAVIMGQRRVDPYCEKLEKVSPSDTDKGYPPFYRINPIIDWSYEQVWEFLLDFKIPYCSLYERGFTYLGNADNTHQNSHTVQQDGTIIPAWKISGSYEQDSRAVKPEDSKQHLEQLGVIFAPQDKIENLKYHLKNKKYLNMVTFNTDNDVLDLDKCFLQVQSFLQSHYLKTDILICTNYEKAEQIKEKANTFNLQINETYFI
ncbi:phosphoadenosine phosphosulfate reductase family protein (macronuclear) [Tetrahymena thermophila SB210]|uniref:FAD synthase n=1 Tax=Tetrahymena thermophila (strain SB210) TaxID=312017 RepID=Q23YR1_TETTS|nr:phosphoadenosine phosphosulfate reductase family protein [Tetrahymena thermophila SB210]EAS01661.1 phosphoadenosine phosphosulfate reductase family protein [Tetrahymena thermophila SB210]|eukprot:XP_001021906.1 phosphoadenosine phosphosulfate reductase family protein [Tetrahymena thermophila SB210]